MWLGLLGALAIAPLYWLAVPPRWRREAVMLLSLAGLALYDPRLVLLVSAVSAGVFAVARATRTGGARLLTVAALVALALLFVWNKSGGGRPGALATQHGLVLIGVSYLVLKAAAALVDAAQGALPPVALRDVLGWIAFLPTYPAGPMAELGRFHVQHPVFDRARLLAGLERILIGLLKAPLAAHYLGQWADPVLTHPGGHAPAALLLALYALTLRFYLDFAGYSDIAIGVSAVFGYDIEENFESPLVRRNLVQLWQRWHMTLTRWLRLYLFLPVSRSIMRRGGAWGDRIGPAAGQIVAMTFCGLWHGLTWGFAVWGFLHALGLIWVGIVARDVGRVLPPGLVAWWRENPLAYALSTALTFNAFSLSMVFVEYDLAGALNYLRVLCGA